MKLSTKLRRGAAAWAVCALGVLAACGGDDAAAPVAPQPSNPGPGVGGTTPLAITTPPQALSAIVGDTVTFSVVASGTAPLSYQWLRDSVEVAGATAASLAVGPLIAADDGAGFSVRVGDASGNMTSTVAVLSVAAAPPGPGALGSSVAAGYDITLAVRGDGAVLQLSSEAPWSRVPGTAVAGSTARLITGLSAGSVDVDRLSALAVGRDGLLYGWGINQSGLLGGSEGNGNVDAPRALGGVSQVKQGLATAAYSLALREDGSVWHWPGTLTFGGGGAVSAPLSIAGLSDVRALTTLSSTVDFQKLRPAAIRSDGTVWELGWTAQTVAGGSGPVQTHTGNATQVPGLADIVRISCSFSHCLASTLSGTLLAWGQNGFGQLGNGATSVSEPTPVAVTGLSDVTAIAAVGAASVAITSDGQVWTWGERSLNAQATGTDLSVPAALAGLPAAAVAVSGGWQHVSVKLADGSLWGWGANQGMQLGDGSTTQRPTPVQASALNLN